MKKKHIRRIRKSRVKKDEIVADIIFLLISFVASFMVVFLFDVHHSFYEWPILPLKYIFKTSEPYFYLVPLGTIVLFILIKLFIYGIQEDEKALEEKYRL
ncbi:MAG: hypothetical protein GXO64_01845 [Candidatus Micrarchaeota archaeon]|nr:hypothetical protein [Candidatus Micrarchaeota archaeon]